MMRMNFGAAVLVSGALLVAGCGGSSSPGVAHLSSSTSGGSAADSGGQSSTPERSASTQQKMVAYSQCMRSHGVPEFPEPNEGHLLIHSSNHNGHVTGVNPRLGAVPGGAEGLWKAVARRRYPQPGATGQGAGKRPEVLAVHAHPRSPQLPRSHLLRWGRQDEAEGRQRERDRPGIAAVQGRAEGVPVDRAGPARAVRARPGRDPRAAPAVPAVNPGVTRSWSRERRAFVRPAKRSRNLRCRTSTVDERSCVW